MARAIIGPRAENYVKVVSDGLHRLQTMQTVSRLCRPSLSGGREVRLGWCCAASQ
jgi:hypothetical protein